MGLDRQDNIKIDLFTTSNFDPEKVPLGSRICNRQITAWSWGKGIFMASCNEETFEIRAIHVLNAFRSNNELDLSHELPNPCQLWFKA
jgi:hypothetical protein